MASHARRAGSTRRQLLARTVTIKVRYADFTTITRSHTAPPTRDEADLTARAVRLLDKTDAGRRPVRLLGVSVHNFCDEHGPTTTRSAAVRRRCHRHVGSAPVRQVPARARAAVLRSVAVESDPAYDKFQREREQPFYDLLALIRPAPDMRVVDLGCGTGTLTRDAPRRAWRRARRSASIGPARMLEAQPRRARADGLRFEVGTIEIVPRRRRRLRPDLLERGAPLGRGSRARCCPAWPRRSRPAVSSPSRCRRMHDEPSHLVAEELTDDEPFRTAFGGWRPPAAGPDAGRLCAAALSGCGFADPHVRLIVYPHVLAGRDEVVEWMKGTLLTEYERHLPRRAVSPRSSTTIGRGCSRGSSRRSRSSFRSSGYCVGAQRSA